MAKDKVETEKQVASAVKTTKTKTASKVITVSIDEEYDAEKHGKVAKQVVGTLAALDALGGSSERGKLLDEMGSHVTSVQTMNKIFQHYRGTMISKNLIKIEEQTAEAA